MNDGPVPDYIPKPGVQRAYQPNPADRLSGHRGRESLM